MTTPLQYDNYVSLLRWRAENQANKLAYVYLEKGEQESEHFTYGSLDKKVRSISSYLQKLCAEKERVLLLFESDLNYVSSFLACNYTNAVGVTLHPPARKKHLVRIQQVAKNSAAKFALTTSEIYNNIQQDIELCEELKNIFWVTIDTIPLELSESWKMPKINHNDLAMLQYTSGSTSTPRGVMLTHFNLIYQGAYIREGFQLSDQEEVMVTWLPHFHDMGLFFGILQPLYQGFPCYVMTPLAFLKKPLRWLQAISKYKGTVTAGPNFSFDLCIETYNKKDCENLNLESWAVALNGAEPVRKSTLENFAQTFQKHGFAKKTFHPAYGMAEATLVISSGYRDKCFSTCKVDAYQLNKDKVVFIDQRANGREFVSCGRGWLDNKIRIVKPETLEICGENEVGEICVCGSEIAQGYWQDTLATQDTFQMFLNNEGPFLRTGDLGFLDETGELYITGRYKDLIIIHGNNHYPQDIEFTVEESHEAIRPSYVGSFSIEQDEKELLVIIAEIKREALDSFDAREVAQAIFKAVAKEHEIQIYEVVFSKRGYFPKTTSGKVQRNICKKDYLNCEIDEITKIKNVMYKKSG